MIYHLSLFFFFGELDENDILPNLADAPPGDDDLGVVPPEAGEAAAAWHDQRRDAAVLRVKFHVNDASEGGAGTHIDNFLLTKLTYSHRLPQKNFAFTPVYAIDSQTPIRYTFDRSPSVM